MKIIIENHHAFPNSFQSFSLPKSSLVDHRHHCNRWKPTTPSRKTQPPGPSRMAETENTAAGLRVIKEGGIYGMIITFLVDKYTY